MNSGNFRAMHILRVYSFPHLLHDGEGVKIKISNQLQVSSLDLVLQLPAGEVFAKEQLVSTANISHCPVFKMLIYIFFAREVGKHLFHLD